MSGPVRTVRTARTDQGRQPRAVSHPHDVDERQADRAADTVALGGSVAGWSFGSVAPTARVHRQEKGGPKSNEEKLKEAAAKAGEAALETPAGKKLQAEVKELPVVKRATDFLGTGAGKAVAGGGIALGLGALATTKQPLPFQAPTIPLDVITPGLSAKVTVEGPLNAPTFAGLSLTYKEQGPKAKGGPSDKERIAADIARLRAQQEMFKPKAQKDQERAEERAAVARLLGAQLAAGKSTLVPLTGGAPKTVDVPAQEPAAVDKDDERDTEGPPVQREPASPSAEAAQNAPPLDTSRVDDAVRGGGRPLEPTVRSSMEARFGHDFSAVRIHDGAAAQAANEGLRARAFTVGEDIAFSSGGYDSRTTEGRHLLAHELAHVVQQRGGAGGSEDGDSSVRVQRHPITKTGKWALKKLGRETTKKFISKHVARHMRRIVGRRIHTVFLKPRGVKEMVTRTVEEAVQLGERRAGALASEVVEEGGLRITQQAVGAPGKFRIVIQREFAKVIGTRGERVLQIVLDQSGRIVTAFPTDGLRALGLTVAGLGVLTSKTAEAAESARASVQREMALREAGADAGQDDGSWLEWVPIIGDLYGGSLNAGESQWLAAERESRTREAALEKVVAEVVAGVEEDLKRSLGPAELEDLREEVLAMLMSGVAVENADEMTAEPEATP